MIDRVAVGCVQRACTRVTAGWLPVKVGVLREDKGVSTRRGMRGLLAGRVGEGGALVRAGTSDEAGAALVTRFDA